MSSENAHYAQSEGAEDDAAREVLRTPAAARLRRIAKASLGRALKAKAKKH